MAKIALAEDNLHLRKLLSTLLGLKGHQVEVFEDGAAALEAIMGGGSYDLLLSDVNMPRMDGLSLCQAVRDQFDKDELPIILVSVLGAEDDILRGFDAGASDYLVKPFSTKVVQAKIDFYLQRRASAETRQGKRLGPLVEEPKAFPVRFDKYQLEGRLGDGSYGVVYRATREPDGLPVALKLLSREVADDREKLARYFREIAVLQAIDCDTVVRFLDSGYERGRYFLAMELIEGKTVLRRLQEEGALPPAEVAAVGRDVAEALAALAREDLVHRDIKPANVVQRPGGRAVLIDFGLAKGRREDGLTAADEFLGTAEYIAPEVISGERESVASDLFSLGVMLYELATNVAPFHGKTTYDVLMRIASGVPAPPAAAARESVPADLSRTIAALMEADPGARLTDPAEVARRLGASAAG